MMRLLLLSLGFLLASCSTQSTPGVFLAENVNKTNQDGILEAWGPPQSKEALSDGRAAWVYKHARKGTPPSVHIPPPGIGSQGGGFTGVFPRSSQPELVRGTPDTCRQYTLIFDNSGTLREYKEGDC